VVKTAYVTFVSFMGIASIVEAQVTLEAKYQENTKIIARSDINLAQNLQLAGQEIVTKSNQVIITEYASGMRGKDGTLRIKATVRKLTGNWEFPGGIKMEFDSEVPKRKAPVAQLEPVLELLRVTFKTPITHVFSKDGSVKTVEVPEAAKNDLPDLFKNELNTEKLTTQLKQKHESLPNKVVSIGDTWVRDQTMHLEGSQTMTFRIDFKYEGFVKKNNLMLDLVTGKITDVAYDMEDNSGSPLKVKNSNLKPAKSSLELFFDRKQGRFVRANSLVHIKGDMTFEANGMELPGKLDLMIEQNTRDVPGVN